ncbi:uncharacterized protein K452DRAFT_81317 [Aplosporella prunicola CBS 121167]|uniref:Uncharacterized protein n=1 Tax=Aplosporella prunicola CBS 121167 TaxID=1176127 RepID=A0A6A6B8A4_9PEZI|nr:uncharacterized protein K452DRAFT_81317 [Aplosporella prunicola CBS 121167]KAF2139137.1 hypothetical protein K452DRAFT_81317 [Aplosporella prunicola CBS 121167]
MYSYRGIRELRHIRCIYICYYAGRQLIRSLTFKVQSYFTPHLQTENPNPNATPVSGSQPRQNSWLVSAPLSSSWTDQTRPKSTARQIPSTAPFPYHLKRQRRQCSRTPTGRWYLLSGWWPRTPWRDHWWRAFQSLHPPLWLPRMVVGRQSRAMVGSTDVLVGGGGSRQLGWRVGRPPDC